MDRVRDLAAQLAARVRGSDHPLVTRAVSPDGELDYKRFWNDLYSAGGDSGAGSYGRHAEFKASIINGLVNSNALDTVLEFGCGDGNQLSYYQLPSYLGLDVAESAVELCSAKFSNDPTKSFLAITPGEPVDIGRFDLVMSLEVLMHVVNEDDFLWTLDNIFKHSDNFVAILTPLTPLIDFPKGSHELYRNLFPYLVPYLGEFALVDVITHPSVTPEGRRRKETGEMTSDFVILKRQDHRPA